MCPLTRANASFYSPREALLACPPPPPWNLPSFTVESTLTSPLFCFDCFDSPRVLPSYNGSPDTSFLPGNDAADELARQGAPLVPAVISCSLSPLTSRIHSSLFADWMRTVSTKFFDTQVPSISTVELVLPRYARCVLSRLRCNGHSLLLSCLSRIGRIENSSCSACGHSYQDISHLILHCPATDSLRRSFFGDSLSLYDLWSRPWGVARLLGLHGLPPCHHPSEGVG